MEKFEADINNTAYKEGIEAGKQRGIEIGKQRGEHRRERKGVTKIVIKMLKRGYSPEDISEIIDLDIEKVRKIIEEK